MLIVSEVSLSSFLDRLGLDDPGMRTCVLAAFMTEQESTMLPGDQVTACLGWVAATQLGTMLYEVFCSNLRGFLNSFREGKEAFFTAQELDDVARCMLSGHTEPDEEPGE